jgi:Domain of unknown function (DUF4390)
VIGWLVVALAAALFAVMPVRAEPVDVDTLVLDRTDDGGLAVNFSARFGLSRPVEDALLKGVPLIFAADVEVFRKRWYWADKRVASANRTWRLAYQPLTRKYRVTLGGLNQNYDNLSEALDVVSRTLMWKVAEASQIDDDGHYVEFRYQLDTTQLPRPMQIGIGGQPEWTLRVERTLPLN